mgnify:CR=1 FL=1
MPTYLIYEYIFFFNSNSGRIRIRFFSSWAGSEEKSFGSSTLVVVVRHHTVHADDVGRVCPDQLCLLRRVSLHHCVRWGTPLLQVLIYIFYSKYAYSHLIFAHIYLPGVGASMLALSPSWLPFLFPQKRGKNAWLLILLYIQEVVTLQKKFSNIFASEN